MHLNLPNLEAERPLVDEFERLMPSPWRGEPRSFQGVLHGIYVFRCLHTYFGFLFPATSAEVATHVSKRIKTIAEDISELDLVLVCPGVFPPSNTGRFQVLPIRACPGMMCCRFASVPRGSA